MNRFLKGAMILTLAGIIAVSYTHLDVYKRQVVLILLHGVISGDRLLLYQSEEQRLLLRLILWMNRNIVTVL